MSIYDISSGKWSDEADKQAEALDYADYRYDYRKDMEAEMEYSDLPQTFDDYQQQAAKTLVPILEQQRNARQQHAATGLAAEVGEVHAVLQRWARGDYGGNVAVNKLFDELGDVLWYWAEMCSAYGLHAEAVMHHNVLKLRKRQERNTIQGSNRDD